MSADEHLQRVRAARVGAAVELLDVRIRRVNAELHRPAAEGPFSFALTMKPTVSRANNLAVYGIMYQFSSNDSNGQLVLEGTLELSVVYQIPDDLELDDDHLTAFGEVSVLFTAYPYLREILQSLTGRMGLPPLILDVMRSPLEAEIAESKDS